MPHRGTLCAATMLLAFGTAVLVATAARIPRLWYEPVASRWAVAIDPPSATSISVFFVAGVAMSFALAGGIVGYALAAHVSEHRRARAARFVSGLAALVLAWAATFAALAFASGPRRANDAAHTHHGHTGGETR